MTATARETELRVSEIFGPTIQGEGPLIGRPTVFVRLFGCDYRCSWCDSLHAVLPEFRHEGSRLMTVDAILAEIARLSGGEPILVTLSGGNPALQPCGDLIVRGIGAAGLTFALETQGSQPRDWMGDVDHLIVSPKPPSSGETPELARVRKCLEIGLVGGAAVSLKVVVFDERDLDYALTLHALEVGIPFYVQVGNPAVEPTSKDVPAADRLHRLGLLDRLRWLSEQVIARKAYDVRVLPQLHTLMWGNDRGR